MAAKDWDQMKDRAQQMTLTIRTVDGHAIRVTENAQQVLLRIDLPIKDPFLRIKQGPLTHWIRPEHICSITISDG